VSLLRVLSALDFIKIFLNIKETGPVELSIEFTHSNLKQVALEISKLK